MIPYKKEQKDFPSITQIAPKGEHLHPFPRRDIITMEIFKIARNRAALSFFWGEGGGRKATVMQRVKPRMSRGKAVLILIAALAAAGLLTWGILSLVQGQQTTGVTATRLPCPYDENIKAFGNNVLYYDGMSIHCMSATGAVRWSFQLGTNAGFDCDAEKLVAKITQMIVAELNK